MKTHSERITKLTPREWTISIVLHLIVFGLLIWFTPARQVLASLGDKNPPPNAKPPRQDPTQVKEVVKAISQEQADAAKQHVKQLLDEEKKLDQLAKDRLDDYKKQAEPISADAAQKALDLLKQIPPGQDATSQAQKQLAQQQQASLTNPNLANDTNVLKQVRDQLSAAQTAVGQTQSKTQEAQEKALQLMHFIGQDTSASQSEQKAIEAENAAAVSQQTAGKMEENLVQSVWNVNRLIGDVSAEKNRLAQKQTDLSAMNATVTQDQTAAATAKAQVDAATAAYNQAHDQAAANNTPENNQKQNDLHHNLENAQHELDKDTAQQNSDADKAKQMQTEINDAAALKNATTALDNAQAKYNQDLAQLQAAQTASAQAQDAAKQAQSDAINQLASIVNTPAAKPAAIATPGELATDKEVDPSTLDGKDLGQLYDTASQTENRIADKFRVYRATELASIQKLTLPDALQATQVAKPDREKLDSKLLSSTKDVQDFNTYKSEVIKAKQQIQSMVDLSSDMVSMAEAQKNLGKGDVSLQEDNYNKMVANATEDDGAAGKDLTGMTGEQAGGGPEGKHQGQEEGSSDVDDAADTGQKGTGNGGGEAPPDSGIPIGAGGNIETSPIVAELPDMDYANIKPVATRRISETGTHHADWLYVDSWYLIGPFPNAGRANLYTKFPPESIIDLNAVYPGKDGRSLRWVYTQWANPSLRIDHDIEDAPAIYYAYTELYFDQPRDLWIATGSDDKGTMWLNNVMVWNSNDILKGWQPNEGFRKVHFKQGLNRILYRIENGQLAAAFSLMISVKKS